MHAFWRQASRRSSGQDTPSPASATRRSATSRRRPSERATQAALFLFPVPEGPWSRKTKPSGRRGAVAAMCSEAASAGPGGSAGAREV